MVQRRRGRKNERGFALLLVFLMASVVAISLYMELPRYAMQRQRDKEEVLIDRGEQYKRAIQLFVAKAKKYPGDIKELESFQNQRFLRHRYEDPLTGKDEWRLVHIQNGILTDSKVVKPQGPGDKDEKKGPNGFVGELAGLGGVQNQNPGGGGANVKSRTRASDGAMPNMPGQGMPSQPMPGGDLSNQNGQVIMPPVENGQLPGTNLTNQNQFNPNQQPGLLGQNGQMPGMTVTGQQNYPGQTFQPGQTNPNGQQMYPPQGFPGQQIPGQANLGNRPITPTTTGNSFVGGGGSLVGGGSFVGGGTSAGSQPGNVYPGQPLPGQPGAPVNSQIGGVSPYSTQPGANGNPVGFNQQPGAQTQGNAAADMIRNILTTPRPGGMPQQMAGAQTIGGGIAGVASTAEGEGVKVYNERTLYQEWEFLFDPQKVKQIPNPNVSGAGGTPADRMNQGTQPTPPPGFGQTPRPTTGR